ncbi:MAG: hypothetical protein AABX52_00535 [Nanoarchaeota archaeon]
MQDDYNKLAAQNTLALREETRSYTLEQLITELRKPIPTKVQPHYITTLVCAHYSLTNNIYNTLDKSILFANNTMLMAAIARQPRNCYGYLVSYTTDYILHSAITKYLEGEEVGYEHGIGRPTISTHPSPRVTIYTSQSEIIDASRFRPFRNDKPKLWRTKNLGNDLIEFLKTSGLILNIATVSLEKPQSNDRNVTVAHKWRQRVYKFFMNNYLSHATKHPMTYCCVHNVNME